MRKFLKPFRFSLLSLLLVVTACGVLFAWWSNSARRQMRVVAWVEQQGGSVKYAWQLDEDGFYDEKAVSPLPNWIRDSLGEDYFHSVVWVDLTDTPVGDISPLAELKYLKALSLDGTPTSDLSPLAELKYLEALSFSDTQVSDISPLADLKNLEVLFLEDTQVSDLSPLAELKNLELLDLYGTQVSDISPLAKLKSLEGLYLFDTQVSDEQVEKLQRAVPYLTIDR